MENAIVSESRRTHSHHNKYIKKSALQNINIIMKADMFPWIPKASIGTQLL